MIEFNLAEILNQYSLLGLPFLILVIGALASRFTVRSDAW